MHKILALLLQFIREMRAKGVENVALINIIKGNTLEIAFLDELMLGVSIHGNTE